MADGVLLVAAVGAVVVAVALPGPEDAAARLAALEHVLGAVVLAVGLVAVVAAVVDAVADGGGQRALLVLALELALAARPRRAGGRLVRPVLAVHLPVAPASCKKNRVICAESNSFW